MFVTNEGMCKSVIGSCSRPKQQLYPRAIFSKPKNNLTNYLRVGGRVAMSRLRSVMTLGRRTVHRHANTHSRLYCLLMKTDLCCCHANLARNQLLHTAYENDCEVNLIRL